MLIPSKGSLNSSEEEAISAEFDIIRWKEVELLGKKKMEIVCRVTRKNDKTVSQIRDFVIPKKKKRGDV